MAYTVSALGRHGEQDLRALVSRQLVSELDKQGMQINKFMSS